MENFMSAFSSNNNNKSETLKKSIDKEQLDKVISVSSEEIHFINRDIEMAKNNFKDTKTLELQKGITVFTTITSIIEKFGQEKFTFEILSGVIKTKAKENLLKYFKDNTTYKDIKLTIGEKEKTLSEFVNENFDPMCNFFEKIYGENLPSADNLKKLSEFRIITSYLFDGLTEDILKGLSKATQKENDYKDKKEKHEKNKKEIEENKKLTEGNNKTIVKCALGFVAAGLAIAFPPTILISAFVSIFINAKDKESNRILPFADVVGKAAEITKTVLKEVNETITAQVNKFKNEKENEKNEKFNKTIDEYKKFSDEIRKTIGELDTSKATEILKDMNITKENFRIIGATLGIERYGKHQILNKTINNEKFLENTKKQTENKVQICS